MKAITITEINQEELEILVERAVNKAIKPSQSQVNTNKVFTIKNAAKYTECSVNTVRKAFREKRLVGHRAAGRLYFFEKDIIDWIKGKY